MSLPGMGSAPQTPSRRRPAATAASSLERNGSPTPRRSTPLKWPSRILPTEPSARATARSTLHSSANDERRLLPSWGSGAAIASTPDAARSLKGLEVPGGHRVRRRRRRFGENRLKARRRPRAARRADKCSRSQWFAAVIRSRARHRDRRPGTVRTRERACVTSCSIRATVSSQPESWRPDRARRA